MKSRFKPKDLIQVRSLLGMTQEQLGELTGYSAPSISQMESGKMPITTRAEKIFQTVIDKHGLQL